MRIPALLLTVSLFLCACGKDVEETGWIGDVPNVTGTYNLFVTGATGCDGGYDVVTDWAVGYMGVEGEDPSNLIFRFRDELAFDGWVDEHWSYQFGGFVLWNDIEESVYNAGAFEMTDEGMEMSGQFDVVVNDDDIDTNDCTVTARIEGTRIAE